MGGSNSAKGAAVIQLVEMGTYLLLGFEEEKAARRGADHIVALCTKWPRDITSSNAISPWVLLGTYDKTAVSFLLLI